VLGANTGTIDELSPQLADLGFTSRSVASSSDAITCCLKGDVRVVICCAFDELETLSDLPVGVALIFAASEDLTLDITLSCFQKGVQDCWQLPQSTESLGTRLNDVLARMDKWLVSRSEHPHLTQAELERDQRAGRHIQLGMLPPNPMGIGHYRLQHRVEPSLILSGDFVDYFQITDRHFACYVADVSGHGASSAFVTVLLKNFSRRLRREYKVSMLSDPGQILAWINDELIDQQLDKHVAMFFAVLDTQEDLLRYSNAAHFPPAMLVNDGGVVSLEQKGKPLGLFAHAQFETKEVAMSVGARVVVFSDGVLDLILASSLEEKERKLIDAVQENTDMESLWAQLDLSKLGQDDVSCLLITHEH